MASNSEATEEILSYIEGTIELIVTKPERSKVSVIEHEDIICYKITADKEDVGRVIGQKGANIDAIRRICRVIATIRHVRVDIQVAEA